MAKRNDLLDWGRTVGTASRMVSVLSLPTSRKAVDDLRLYLAICVLGHLPWNVSRWTRDRLDKVWQIRLNNRTVDNWINQDRDCGELLRHWRDGEPATARVKHWLKLAQEEIARGEG